MNLCTRMLRRCRLHIETLEGRALLTAGALDPTFGGTGMVSTSLDSTGDVSRAVAVQPDSKVVVVGDTGQNTWPPHIGVVRYNADGSLDMSFGKGGIFIDPFPTNVNGGEENVHHDDVAIQPDGKILVAGGATVAITTTSKKTTTTTDYYDWIVVRLNPNGTLDSTFGNGGQVVIPFGDRSGAGPQAVVIQPADGKIVVAGGASPTTTAGPYGEFTLVRLNTNGTTDATFGSGGVVMTDLSQVLGVANSPSLAESVTIDSSGRIVAGGNAEALNPIARYEMTVVRYTSNGALDKTFGTGGAVALLPSNATMAEDTGVGIQSGGQIVVGGLDQVRNGLNNVSGDRYELAIARVTPTGALDTTFGNGTGFYTSSLLSIPEAMTLQGDGKILVAGIGPYTSPGVTDPNLWVTRVLADGSAADPAFGTNGAAEAKFGVGASPTSVAVDPDGNIVATGWDNLPEFRTARFLGDPSATTTAVASSSNPSPSGQAVSFTATVVTAGPFVPTGTVDFYDGATLLGTGTLALVGGIDTATFTITTLTSGTHSITAAYVGDEHDLASTSAVLGQVID